MKKNRVLTVSDSPDRRNFLEYHVANRSMYPVWYPNIMSARKAIRLDQFAAIIIDLSLPVKPKLNFLKEACEYQSQAKIILIGKTEYLEKSGVIDSFPTVLRLSAIELIPDIMKTQFE